MSKKNNTTAGAKTPAADTTESAGRTKAPEVVNIDVPKAIVVPKYPGQNVVLSEKIAKVFGRSEVNLDSLSQPELKQLYDLGSSLVEIKN